MAGTDEKKLLNQQAAATDSVEQVSSAAQGAQNTQAQQNTQSVQSGQTGQANAITGLRGTAPAQAQAGTQDASALIGLPGVSDATKQALGSLTANGYQPSQAVSNAMAELNGIIAKQPAAYQSQYYNQLQGIMNKILGREGFSYDMAADPLYQQYRQQYIQGGQQAMEDTMGRAAALTGGYGSSYAATTGQQAYNDYLQGLNDKGLELYQLARNAYDAEGDRLNAEYALMNDAYQDEYAKWQDQYNRWLTERDYAQSAYENERNYDYSDYANRLNYWQNIAAMEQDQANAEREYSNAERDYYYDWALQLLSQGKTPSAAVLEAAGLSAEDVAALLGTGSSGGSSGSKRSSGSGSGTAAAANPLSGAAAQVLRNAAQLKSKASGSTGSTGSSTGLSAAEKAELYKRLKAKGTGTGPNVSLWTAVN